MGRVMVQSVMIAALGCFCLAADVGDGSPEKAASAFDYPQPTGEFQVGTAYLFLEDPTRLDAFSDAPDDHRWISVKVWYPGNPPPGAKPAPRGPRRGKCWRQEPRGKCPGFSLRYRRPAPGGLESTDQGRGSTSVSN